MINFRDFEISDLDRIAEIMESSLIDPLSKSYLEKIQDSESFIVAIEKEKVVGYIIGKTKNNLGKIISLAVQKDFRKKGVGTKLLISLTKRFKRSGVKKIFLRTRTWNKKAVDFYKNLGFKIVKEIKNYYKNGDDAFLMEKMDD
ncbi:MAG: ribosomal protein S18-alanine N-acetyltransferase [Candidatus Pacebacteria bacterium]|nr:ribosomal protein S18-alanine N-acetyltransferase [Candidatus Paceibacterota bacterium]